jgi:hypothetical protein
LSFVYEFCRSRSSGSEPFKTIILARERPPQAWIFEIELPQSVSVLAKVAKSARHNDVIDGRSPSVAVGLNVIELQPERLESRVLLTRNA